MDTLVSILNVNLNKMTLCQATLPVQNGRLSIRRVVSTGLAAFLASVHGVADLVVQILPNGGSAKPQKTETLSAWSVLCPMVISRPEDIKNESI